MGQLAFCFGVKDMMIPREPYHIFIRALDIKLGLGISQNCYQKFVTFVTFVPIE